MKNFKSNLFMGAAVFAFSVFGFAGSVFAAEAVSVKTAEDLVKISQEAEGKKSFEGVTIELQNDISLKGIEWNPIGDYLTPFEGSFDGNGYTISDLSVTGEMDYAGLFGFIGENGYVHDVNLKNINVDVHGIYVGGVAGGAFGTIENATVSGRLSGLYDLGGIAGHLGYGVIKNCVSEVTIDGVINSDNVGGVVGRVYGESAKLTGCTNKGSVKGDDGVGGVVGLVVFAEVSDCKNFGTVKGGELVGDVIGYEVGPSIW